MHQANYKTRKTKGKTGNDMDNLPKPMFGPDIIFTERLLGKQGY